MIKKFYVLITIVVLLVGLVGCQTATDFNDNDSNLPDGSGELVMTIADKPVNDVEKVLVTLKEVQVKKDETQWETINDFSDSGGEKQFDLLTLRFNEELLGQEILETGNYNQIRLIVAADKDGAGNGNNPEAGKSKVVYKDDTVEDDAIFIPSGVQTGLKINHDFVIEEGIVKRLLLDVNVADMLHAAGNSGKIILSPTSIKVIDKIISGDIKGQVVASDNDEAITDSDVVVAAIQNDSIVDYTTTTTEETEGEPAGSYLLRGLIEGTYDIKAYVTNGETEEIDGKQIPVIDDSTYSPKTISNVEVTAEEVTTQDIALAKTPGNIEGTVLSDTDYDNTNEVITDENVKVDVIQDNEVIKTVSEITTDGLFTIDELNPGTYTVKAYVADEQGEIDDSKYLPQEITNIEVNSGETKTLDQNIILDHKGGINGKVLADDDNDSSTEPVVITDPDYTVTVEILNDNDEIVKTNDEVSKDDGSFQIKEITEGTYTIKAYIAEDSPYEIKELSGVNIENNQLNTEFTTDSDDIIVLEQTQE